MASFGALCKCVNVRFSIYKYFEGGYGVHESYSNKRTINADAYRGTQS
ncbi:hypothetical protein PAECIP111894_01296 [Paenibacillus pseudetheri]|uniref:Uncharacterized protein n=1 Tax=Paenibacillus pseudetheri TaxID=2897682 RepID=A0ABN8FB38_9BACL|nr:hypothetical protein PAECIP111894_01296 [Paenibacillus pseudetheri]